MSTLKTTKLAVLTNNLQNGNPRTQLIVFGVLFGIAIIAGIVMQHMGIIHIKSN